MVCDALTGQSPMAEPKQNQFFLQLQDPLCNAAQAELLESTQEQPDSNILSLSSWKSLEPREL